MKLEKWIRENKKVIFAFLFGVIMSSAISVSAAILVAANQVSLSSTLTSQTTVQGALDELYNLAYSKSTIGANARFGDYLSLNINPGNVQNFNIGPSFRVTIESDDYTTWRVYRLASDYIYLISESTLLSYTPKNGETDIYSTINYYFGKIISSSSYNGVISNWYLSGDDVSNYNIKSFGFSTPFWVSDWEENGPYDPDGDGSEYYDYYGYVVTSSYTLQKVTLYEEYMGFAEEYDAYFYPVIKIPYSTQITGSGTSVDPYVLS